MNWLLCLLLAVSACGPTDAVEVTARPQPLMKPGTWQCNWWETPSPAHVLLIRTGDSVCMGIGTNVSLVAAEGYTWHDGQYFGLHTAWFKARRSNAGQGVMSVLLGDDMYGYNSVYDGPAHVYWYFDNNGWGDSGAGYYTSFGTNFPVRNVNNANW